MRRDPLEEPDLEFLLLGPLEVRSGGSPLRLRSAKQRALLAVFLLHANEVVSSDRLIEAVWPEKPPGTATNLLQVHVSQLRKLLEPGRAGGTPGLLVTRAPGYMLRVDPQRLDSVRFEQLLKEGLDLLAGDDPQRASATIEEALGLWRGPALADLAFEEFARAESARLDDLRTLAIEEGIEAALALGRHASLVGELEALVVEHPLRERLAGQLMVALYRSKRQAEALDVYSATRKRLVDGLGIEPSPTLKQLERAILDQDPSLDLPAVPGPAPERAAAERDDEPENAAGSGARRIVTVLFADYVLTPTRSETIDPETLEPVFSRLGEGLSSAIERHGGSIHWSSEIEFIAVFGIPHVHEDDALRAVRAAIDLRDAVASLTLGLERDFGVGIDVRIGVNTGDVVAGVAFASTAMGGASSIAARLARAASPGEIYVADPTRDLTRDAITVEPVTLPRTREADATGVWRLLGVVPGAAGVERRLSSPMVGRTEELETLRRAYDSAGRGRGAALVTVLGPAGIGKSHLARALCTAVGDEARVLLGRCLSYGEGSTFAPLAEIVRDVAGDDSHDALRGLLAGHEDRDVIAEHITTAIGLSECRGGSETALWAVRKLFEALARERPLVLVFDDLHWAEPSFLDLVEYVLDWTFDAPILMLGLARPELLEERPGWAGGKRNATSLLLEPLADAESEALIDGLLAGSSLDPKHRARVVEAAGGNPFFIEQMLAMCAGRTGSDAVPAVPPTIRALLSARFDRLRPEQRAVLEHASIMGKEFWRGALVELAPRQGRDSIGESLRALVREQLIEPCRSALPIGDALRFNSTLIRDAAYESVPKRSRAVLHEAVARWFESEVGELAGQYDEVLGYHLEQAFRYREELGPVDHRGRSVAREGAQHLAAAGRRAFGRGDMSAAGTLLRRAAALLPAGDPERLDLLPVLGEALHEIGDFGWARASLDEAVEAAGRSGDSCLAAKARLVRALVDASAGAEDLGDSFVRMAEQTTAIFEEAGDDAGLATAFRMLAWAHGTAGRYGDAAEAARRAIEEADRAGDARQHARAVTLYALAAVHGPTPVSEAIDRCRDLVDDVAGDRRAEGLVASILGWLHAMRGDFDVARELAGRGRTILVDLGTGVVAASQLYSQVEMLADNPSGAELDLRRDYEALTEIGETYLRSTVAGYLAQAVYAQGRYVEALELSRRAEDLAADDDVTSQAFWRSVRAKVLARQKNVAEAVPLAEQAVELLRRTDGLVTIARALVDLAEVLALDDRPDEAREAIEEAVRLFERKGNVIGARQAADAVDALLRPPIATGA
jgi:DNA-binding SARP family transcriptional activator/tetratricopeptide (TPR) repeat protein